MLPSAARLTRSQDFRLVVRRGRRAGRAHLVVHLLRAEGAPEPVPTRDRAPSPRVGFVVSKAIGSAVVRHRVARRFRHLMRDRLPLLPAGTLVVVRALPPAARASSDELGADLDSALRKLRVLNDPPAGWPR